MKLLAICILAWAVLGLFGWALIAFDRFDEDD